MTPGSFIFWLAGSLIFSACLGGFIVQRVQIKENYAIAEQNDKLIAENRANIDALSAIAPDAAGVIESDAITAEQIATDWTCVENPSGDEVKCNWSDEPPAHER